MPDLELNPGGAGPSLTLTPLDLQSMSQPDLTPYANWEPTTLFAGSTVVGDKAFLPLGPVGPSRAVVLQFRGMQANNTFTIQGCIDPTKPDLITARKLVDNSQVASVTGAVDGLFRVDASGFSGLMVVRTQGADPVDVTAWTTEGTPGTS